MEDDRVSLLEQQLAQAKLIAEEADKKYEEVCKILYYFFIYILCGNARICTVHLLQNKLIDLQEYNYYTPFIYNNKNILDYVTRTFAFEMAFPHSFSSL